MESIRVYLRIRPHSETERMTEIHGSAILIVHPNAVIMAGGNTAKNEVFTFDSVGGEDTDQEAVFQ